MLVNGVDLNVETFGDPADPAIVLVGGDGGSTRAWAEAFCRRLARSRFVLRYHRRDANQSTIDSPDTAADPVTDVAGLLDAYGVRQGNLVAAPAGAAIARAAAVRYPTGWLR